MHLVERLHQERTTWRELQCSVSLNRFYSLCSGKSFEESFLFFFRVIGFFFEYISRAVADWISMWSLTRPWSRAVQFNTLLFFFEWYIHLTTLEMSVSNRFNSITLHEIVWPRKWGEGDTAVSAGGSKFNSVWNLAGIRFSPLSFISCTININMSRVRRHRILILFWNDMAILSSHFIMIFLKVYIFFVYFYI